MTPIGFATLDVERVTSQAACLPSPGGSVSPADAASPCRAAGDALGAEERPGGHGGRERAVRAGECLTVCPRCGSPVLHRIENKNGRSGCARPGHAQEVVSPMPERQYTLAQDALDRAFLGSGIQRIEAACPCGDDLDGALVLIREVEDGEIVDTLVADLGYGDGPTVLDCDPCGRALVPDIAALRPRRAPLAEVA